jgi:arylsulfatase A-like enzyme
MERIGMPNNGKNFPNLLFIFLDELRADVMGSYGHPFIETPTIDRLATEGVRFDQHYTNCPLCIPARTAMMSSLYPHQTGVTTNVDLSSLGYEVDTYLTFNHDLRDLGFDTITNIGKVHLPGEADNDIGPDRYTGWKAASFDNHVPIADPLGADPHTVPEGMSESEALRGPGKSSGLRSIIGGTHPGAPGETLTGRTVDEALKYISRAPNEPWALRVSINRPHTPVLPPAPYDTMYEDEVTISNAHDDELESRPSPLLKWHSMRGVSELSTQERRQLRSHYYGLVTFIDDQLGRLFQRLEEHVCRDNLLTIFTADHGSSLGDHGQLTKGPYDSTDITRVPLIFHWPEGIDGGREYSDLSQIIDLLPTLVDLLGGEPRDRYEGRSLAPVLSGGHPRIHDEIFIEGSFPEVHPGMRETIRTLDWRYTRYEALNEDELIDLSSDPDETTDVSANHPRKVEKFRSRIEEWKAETAAVHADEE